MFCLHTAKALWTLQSFTSQRPRAGPPDIATQPPVLTSESRRCRSIKKKSEKVYESDCITNVKLKNKHFQTLGYLAGAYSSLWRWEAERSRYDEAICTLPSSPGLGPWDQSSNTCYFWPHFHSADCWQMPAQTCQQVEQERRKVRRLAKCE